MIYLVDFRAAGEGGAVVPGFLVTGRLHDVTLGTKDQLQTETKVTFLLHGFNVDRVDGRRMLLQLAGILETSIEGAIVAVLWPGDHWARAASFPLEGRDADDTAAELHKFMLLNLLARPTVSFLTHSLGARVALNTIDRVGGTAAQRDRFEVDQVCLMAAAIDDYSLADRDVYQTATDEANRVAVLASKKDRVLKFAYPAGDLLQAFKFWEEDFGLALGYHGPRDHGKDPVPPNVRGKSIAKDRVSRHADYLPDGKLNDNQTSAIAFATDVLQGKPEPKYPEVEG